MCTFLIVYKLDTLYNTILSKCNHEEQLKLYIYIPAQSSLRAATSASDKGPSLFQLTFNARGMH